MENSRTKNAILILLSSSIRQGLMLIITFIIRTVFIRTLGSEYLGLNGLFTNILSILALSELGIGTAITFYLYRPIEEKDIKRIKSLMVFYKRCYRFVGLAIIGIGILLMPLLHYVVKFETDINVNLYIVYFLFLINTSSSYLLFAYKQSFLLANQQQYKVEHTNTIFCLVQFGFDFINIAIFKNFYTYLIGDIIIVLIKNIFISIITDRDFPFLEDRNAIKISDSEFRHFFKDIFSVSIFRIGSQLFNATDNIIISILLGTKIVGYYSNYYLIISYATLLVGMIMKAFTAGIGNAMAKETREKNYILYKRIDFLMFSISTVTSVCMCQLFNSFMKIWVGSIDRNYIFMQSVIFILSFDYYINCTCQTSNTFRETSGNFETGQWLQLIGGIVNIILSFIFGYKWGLLGIFLATIVSKLSITVTPFLWGISRTVFVKKPLTLILDYYKKMGIRTLTVILVWYLCKNIHMTNFMGLFLETVICIFSSLFMIFVFYCKTEELHYIKNKIKTIIINSKL